MSNSFAGITDSPVKGNGIPGERIVECGDFTQLNLNGTVDVILRHCPVTSIIIHGDENLLPLVEFDKKQSILTITDTRPLKPQLKMLIEICTPTISSIELSGAADLTAIDLRCNQLTLRLSGAGDLDFSGHVGFLETSLSGVGDLHLAGRANSLSAKLSGVGDLRAASMPVEQVEVSVSGVGDATVRPLASLKANISGVGDITYFGDPSEQKFTVTGIGEIIHHHGTEH